MLNRISKFEKRRQIYDQMCEESGKFIFQIGFWIFDRLRSTFVDVNKITCPVRIIVGDQDRATPPVIAKANLKRLKHSKWGNKHSLEIIMGGHWLFEERPEEILRKICG